MLGSYEYTRDNYKYPTWWHSENDNCLPHFHSSIELAYVCEGELSAYLNGKLHRVPKNHLVVVPSYTVHSFVTEKHSECIIMVVPLDFVPVFAKMIENKTFLHNICLENSKTSEIIRSINAVAASQSGNDMNKPVIKGYFYVILGLLAEKLGLGEGADTERTLAREILIYLQENYCAPLTLDEVAAHFGYSKSRFSHIFSELFGSGVHQYITSLRCRHAASLMVEESLPMIDAAMNSGFESMRTFYRSFKICFGTTPTQYCENYLERFKRN